MKIVMHIPNLRQDEEGSAMTEFVIGLPVFIMLFIGILNMHALALGGVLVKGRAHAKMWTKAIEVQTDIVPGWEASPISAAGEAANFHRNTGGTLLDYALDAGEGVGAITGASGGIMANSYMRVKPIDYVENIGATYDGDVTWNINEDYLIVQEDSIANDLMSDALDFSAFGGSSGGLGILNGVLDFAGVRPALAAGVRYGISGDYQEDTIRMFGGRVNANVAARSHVANAPRATSRYVTFAVVRLTMAKKDRYDTAIAFTLKPEFEGMGDAMEVEVREYEECQDNNANLPPGETPADCGDAPEVEPAGNEDDLWGNTGDCKGSWCR